VIRCAGVPTDAELELAFYDKFLLSRGLEPYPVQEQAITKIFAGESVLVTVPTGTGKTLMAKAALHAAIGRGHRAIYTTPLRALTEEKFRELSEDFGEENVGFATGDYKVNREAPIQVEVAEILWNRIVADKHVSPAEIVVMDEGHYFNDPERGYVWEQSIIGLDPRTQLVVLSATVGHPDRFCQWVEVTRRVPMALVESRERKVPLVHEFREEMMIDTVRELAHTGDVPAIIFVFGREQCFEIARLIKSCRRFTTDEEKAKIELMCDEALLPSGAAKELRPLLTHGIGIHHAGILPRYKQLVEALALERLIKFVVSTERDRDHARARRDRQRHEEGAQGRREAPRVRRGQGQEEHLQQGEERGAAQGRHRVDARGARRAREGRAGRAPQQDEDHRGASARDRAAGSHEGSAARQ